MRFLQKLDLSNNHFVGYIPQSIGNFLGLQYLDLSANNLSGKIPGVLGNCNQLLSLNLSHNALSGKVPSQLRNLQGIQLLLDLSSNSLFGSIPHLDNLESLLILNLSHNHFTGIIPQSLSKMISLQFFDLSYNNISGSVPEDTFFLQRGLFIGNRYLCGNPFGLSPCSYNNSYTKHDSNYNSHRKRKKVVIVVVPLPISSVLLLSACAVAVWLYFQKYKQHNVKTIMTDIRNLESFICRIQRKFRFWEIKTATDDFSDAYLIEKGRYGSVYRASLSSGQVFAVKKLNMADFPLTNRRSFEYEIRTLTEVRHRNIIKLYGYCSAKGSTYLVYDYAERGSLRKMLYSEETTVELGWERRVNTVKGLAHAVSYLHHDCTPPIIHRDIAINNVLLDKEFEPRLSDFGTAKLLSSDTSNWTSVAGTHGYMAPGKSHFHL